MSHTDRLTVFLDDRDNRALRSARIKDGAPASDRIRAAVQLWQQGGPVADRINSRAASERVRAALHLWQQDPQFRVAVDDLAAELRLQKFADRAAGGHPAVPPDLAVTAS